MSSLIFSWTHSPTHLEQLPSRSFEGFWANERTVYPGPLADVQWAQQAARLNITHTRLCPHTERVTVTASIIIFYMYIIIYNVNAHYHCI